MSVKGEEGCRDKGGRSGKDGIQGKIEGRGRQYQCQGRRKFPGQGCGRVQGEE